MARVGRYLAFILVAIIGSVTLHSMNDLPRDASSVAIAIAAVAGLELVESRIKRTSSATFRELAETINEVFWPSAPDFSKFYYVSPACDRFTGYNRRELSNVSLLVTDVVMPGMDGRILAERARASQPDLRVIFSTGYTDDAVLEHGIRRAEVALLEKPFRTRELAGKIREILDA